MKQMLIFWLDQPPKVAKGCFNYISQLKSYQVLFVYLHDFSETRKKANWDDDDFGDADLIHLQGDIPTEVAHLFEQYPDAIHIVGGFKSTMMKYVKPYVKKGQRPFIFFAERPGVYGTWWKRLLKRMYIPLSEIAIAHAYKKRVCAYLPLGIKGVETAAKYHWPREMLYPFMYDPVNYVQDDTVRTAERPIRFLYVGRFSRYTKGTDVLARAFDLVRRDHADYSLDMVGGYGDLRENMLAWIEKQDNVRFLGLWDSKEVGNRMKDYDVCIVPSKFDGWNLLINEALRAHIGVIATDEAVSDEMVTESGAGLVVHANKPREMAEAITYAIDHPDIVYEWKNKAKDYAPLISSQSVGEYLIQIIDYTCHRITKERPECPWLEEKSK